MTEQIASPESTDGEDQQSKKRSTPRKKPQNLSSESTRCITIWRHFNKGTPSFNEMSEAAVFESLIKFLNSVAAIADRQHGGKGDPSQVTTLLQAIDNWSIANANSAVSAPRAITEAQPANPISTETVPTHIPPVVTPLEAPLPPALPAKQNPNHGGGMVSNIANRKAMPEQASSNPEESRRRPRMPDSSGSGVERQIETLVKGQRKFEEIIQHQLEGVVKKQDTMLRAAQRALELRLDEVSRKQNQEIVLRRIEDLQTGITERSQADDSARELLLTSLKSQCELIHDRLGAKIDLQDATQLMELRQEVERFVQAALIQSMSKQIMPAVEILKDLVQGRETALIEPIRDLEHRCKQAGLIPLDKLFG